MTARARAALAAAATALALPTAAAAGPAVADETAPSTAIVRHPVNPTTARHAIFEFWSPPDGATQSFQCRLDRGPWQGCWIEAKYKKLDLGRHVFRVRAVADGVTDPTPAKFRWRIRKS